MEQQKTYYGKRFIRARKTVTWHFTFHANTALRSLTAPHQIQLAITGTTFQQVTSVALQQDKQQNRLWVPSSNGLRSQGQTLTTLGD